MPTRLLLVFAVVASVLGLLLATASAGRPEEEVPQAPEIPPDPDKVPPPGREKAGWLELEFHQSIPLEWGTIFTVQRVAAVGESYTFWFLSADGTLRGVTTREFQGPNRATFHPEVYVIRRK